MNVLYSIDTMYRWTYYTYCTLLTLFFFLPPSVIILSLFIYFFIIKNIIHREQKFTRLSQIIFCMHKVGL